MKLAVPIGEVHAQVGLREVAQPCPSCRRIVITEPTEIVCYVSEAGFLIIEGPFCSDGCLWLMQRRVLAWMRGRDV